MNMAKHLKVNGETPNGGGYSEIYYLDSDGNIVDETEAVRCVIRECTEDGELIAETWGIVRRGK